MTEHPVIVIGAGPVGLAAAAHLLERKLEPLVIESGPEAGAGIRRWGHVRLFSPWRYAVDAASRTLLDAHGWHEPDASAYPTGHDIVDRYLAPLASALAPRIRFNSRVVGVSRRHHDRMKDGVRERAPFLVRVATAAGGSDLLARAVIDASGTVGNPAPLGASGLPALGEPELASRIFYGIPEVTDRHRARYAGRRVLVAGCGHSALNVLLDLARVAEEEPATRITWAIRRGSPGRILGGARPDQLEARGRLGARVRALLEQERFALAAGWHIDRVTAAADGILASAGDRTMGPFDEIVAATGFRPDWSILSEVRLDLDPALESPRALAPLIDPNVHSCGTVPPHGAEELKGPEPDLYIAGMKSYGRAPTFLMVTGYEQVRSVAAAIAGDWEAARRVELVLPDTGVCSSDAAPAAAGVACCP